MKPPAIVRKFAVLCLLLASNAAGAAVVTASPSNSGERQLLNNLNVNVNVTTPDAQPVCVSDTGCPLQTVLPVAAANGQGTLPGSTSSMTATSGPLAGGISDSAPPMAASQAKTEPNVANYAIEAADKYASDEELKWSVKLKLLQTYEGMRSLFSLGDKTPDKAPVADNMAPGQPRDFGPAGANAGYTDGGVASGLNSMCVARDGSYNTVGAASQRSCPQGSIYVSTASSASRAEYAAYSQSLNYAGKGMSSGSSLQPAGTVQFSHNDATPVQYKRCTDCGIDQTGALDPGLLRRILNWLKDPVSMLLVGLGVVAILVVDAVIKARKRL